MDDLKRVYRGQVEVQVEDRALRCAILPKWVVVEENYSTLRYAIVGPRAWDRITVETALEVGVLKVTEVLDRAPDAKIGYVGYVGDMRGHGPDGLMFCRS